MGYELQSSGFNSNLSTTCVLVPIVTCCGYVWAWFKNLALWPMTWLFSSGGRHPKAVSVSSNLGPTKQHGEHRTKINRKCNFYNSNICDRNFKSRIFIERALLLEYEWQNERTITGMASCTMTEGEENQNFRHGKSALQLMHTHC